jgi:predicted DNA-binding transcriptional regulator
MNRSSLEPLDNSTIKHRKKLVYHLIREKTRDVHISEIRSELTLLDAMSLLLHTSTIKKCLQKDGFNFEIATVSKELQFVRGKTKATLQQKSRPKCSVQQPKFKACM